MGRAGHRRTGRRSAAWPGGANDHDQAWPGALEHPHPGIGPGAAGVRGRGGIGGGRRPAGGLLRKTMLGGPYGGTQPGFGLPVSVPERAGTGWHLGGHGRADAPSPRGARFGSPARGAWGALSGRSTGRPGQTSSSGRGVYRNGPEGDFSMGAWLRCRRRRRAPFREASVDASFPTPGARENGRGFSRVGVTWFSSVGRPSSTFGPGNMKERLGGVGFLRCLLPRPGAQLAHAIPYREGAQRHSILLVEGT